MKKPTPNQQSENLSTDQSDMSLSTVQDYGGASPDQITEPDNGTVMGGVLMLRQIATQEWIFANIVPKGKGHRENVGAVRGWATGYFMKKGTLPDGREKESCALTGTFSLESLITGEVQEGHTIYLPDNVSLRVKGNLDMLGEDEAKRVVLDLDIGVRNTGKGIPYEWVAVSYIRDKGTELLRQMRNARKPSRVPLLGKTETKLIEG